MILELNNITHYYGSTLILKDISFKVEAKERLGIVGYNGCGKTTLLRIITKELTPSSGTISSKEGVTIGYLKQAAGLRNENTVFEEMKTISGVDRIIKRMNEIEHKMGEDDSLISEYTDLSARFEAIGGYELDYRIRKILFGMSFLEADFTKKIAVLSGGEKTRLAFAKLLVSNPDILVLDEPTNHLDMNTLEWLEEYLLSYNGAVVAVSHDRFFLDRIMGRICEIINNKAFIYRGNYTKFIEQREFKEAQQLKDYQETMEKAEKYRTYAERNIERDSSSNMAKSRLKMLGRLNLERPENLEHEKVRFQIEISNEPFKEVLTLENVDIKVGNRTLVKGLDFTLLRQDRVAIVGPNGSGKTTLLNVIDSRRMPDNGTVKIGGGVKKSFLEQNITETRTESPIMYIWDRYTSMTQLQIRNLLASIGFRGEDVFLPGNSLSGGELAKLHMARISLERPNFLILDEPSNHLDIYTKELLTKALEEYKGTMIVVSHDRYLLSHLNAKILLLDGKGGTTFFESFNAYREFLEKEKANNEDRNEQDDSFDSERGTPNQKEQRRQRALHRDRISFLEENISKLEGRIIALENEAMEEDVVSDHIRLGEIYTELDELRVTLSSYSDEWIRLT